MSPALVSRGSRKYYRTILLGIAAMAALVWMAVDQFGIPWQEILTLFLATVAVVGIVILAAAGFALLWVVLRKLFQGD